MRNIQFRGKRVDNGQWVYGGYHFHTKRQISPIGDGLSAEDTCHLIIQSGFADWNMARPIITFEVIPETVGQLTDLIDKHGRQIYEGDLIKDSMTFKLVWDPKSSQLIMQHLYDESYYEIPYSFYVSKLFEVVGNIHDIQLDFNNESR